jgi:hypothetical protein
MRIRKNVTIRRRVKLHVDHRAAGGFRNIAGKEWTKPRHMENNMSEMFAHEKKEGR